MSDTIPMYQPLTPVIAPENNLQQFGLLVIMLLREMKGLGCHEQSQTKFHRCPAAPLPLL